MGYCRVPNRKSAERHKLSPDSRQKIFNKLQKLKAIFLPDLRKLHLRISFKCQQPMAADQLDKLKLYRTKIHRMMQYFQVSKGNIPLGFPESKIDAVEKQIQTVLNSFKPRKPAPTTGTSTISAAVH